MKKIERIIIEALKDDFFDISIELHELLDMDYVNHLQTIALDEQKKEIEAMF